MRHAIGLGIAMGLAIAVLCGAAPRHAAEDISRSINVNREAGQIGVCAQVGVTFDLVPAVRPAR
jgi:hypothetical protein